MPDLQANTVPELYNGAGGVATIPIRAGAIPAEYKWVDITNMTRDVATANIKAFVRAYYGVLGVKEITERNVAAPATFDVTAREYAGFAPSVTHVAAVPMIRKMAMCIGAARAGLVSMWNVDGPKLINAEVSTAAVFTYAGGRITTMHAIADADFTLVEALAYGMVEFTAAEDDILYAIFQLAMAVVPLAGLSILSTGHHYLTSNKVATDAVMRQVMATSTEATKAWFAVDTAIIKDLIWHKAAHPVLVNHLTAQALSTVVAERLKSASMGSAAVRLPYVEPEMKAAQAMITAINAVQQVIQDTNGTLEVPTLIGAMATVKLFDIGAVDVMVAPNVNHPLVLNRRAAVNDVLVPAMRVANIAVAYALGIYTAMSENATARDRRSTLLTAKSLERIKADNMTTAAAGASLYENLMRKERADAAQGIVQGPNFSA